MAADDTEEDRLEAALERIARAVGRQPPAGADPAALARLDRLIATVQGALAAGPHS